MPKIVRSALGAVVDFELLAIKQQLAAKPVPKPVEERKQAIDEKDGVKSSVLPDADFLAISAEAAAREATQGKQLKRK
jgi:hypothetical protein